jgi:hypothetical protein
MDENPNKLPVFDQLFLVILNQKRDQIFNNHLKFSETIPLQDDFRLQIADSICVHPGIGIISWVCQEMLDIGEVFSGMVQHEIKIILAQVVDRVLFVLIYQIQCSNSTLSDS